MNPYSVKLTIYGMEGAFADKYSYTVRDAHVLHRYFEELSGTGQQAITLMEKSEYNLGHDPMALFPVLMKHLRRVAKERAKRRFFLGARFEPTEGAPGEWAERAEAGAVALEAFGRKAWKVIGEEREELTKAEEVKIEVEGGHLVARWDSWLNLFKDDLLGIVSMCEESLAKNQDLVAHSLPYVEVLQGGEALPPA